MTARALAMPPIAKAHLRQGPPPEKTHLDGQKVPLSLFVRMWWDHDLTRFARGVAFASLLWFALARLAGELLMVAR